MMEELETVDNMEEERTGDMEEESEFSIGGLEIMKLNDNKAGMVGLDRDRINQILEEASRGSKFYEHKKKCQERINMKIQELQERKRRILPEQLERSTKQMDEYLKQLEQEQDLSHTIVHVDMDAFYAAVEMRDDPSLCEKPMAVGGNSMLSTSNYLARRYGVRAAMPGFIAKKLCPGLIIVPCIAPNAMLAKVCSDYNKPNGQFYLPPTVEAVRHFIDDLPLRKIPGIGNVTGQLLASLGVTKCRDVCENRGLINLLFSELSCHHFMQVSLGMGSTSLSTWTERERKSISVEQTFQDTSDKATLIQKCRELSEDLSEEMKEKQLVGKAVTLKIKTSGFAVKTKVRNMASYTNDVDEIFMVAQRILHGELDQPVTLRLMGVRMSSLLHESEVAPGKQVKLKDMLSRLKEKPAQPITSCPVCKKFQSGSERQMMAHIETCLVKKSSQVELLMKSQEGSSDMVKSGMSMIDGITCPVCNQSLEGQGETGVSTHVNWCLESTEPSPKNPKKRTPTQQNSHSKKLRTLDSFLVKK
ncbi:unnamed protein product [Darwinula stevensoni]|uniref:DNA polymerase kappa n=1 Tax=Darwinula stevensoni TaxID=69355 RepID=A0A7R8X4G1_9CRUS|nr:unnamed protein product [Darwinula stevensoni]CAG0879653.1 unnamed protein product [Darwinula stevensoni]